MSRLIVWISIAFVSLLIVFTYAAQKGGDYVLDKLQESVIASVPQELALEVGAASFDLFSLSTQITDITANLENAQGFISIDKIKLSDWRYAEQMVHCTLSISTLQVYAENDFKTILELLEYHDNTIMTDVDMVLSYSLSSDILIIDAVSKSDEVAHLEFKATIEQLKLFSRETNPLDNALVTDVRLNYHDQKLIERALVFAALQTGRPVSEVVDDVSKHYLDYANLLGEPAWHDLLVRSQTLTNQSLYDYLNATDAFKLTVSNTKPLFLADVPYLRPQQAVSYLEIGVSAK